MKKFNSLTASWEQVGPAASLSADSASFTSLALVQGSGGAAYPLVAYADGTKGSRASVMKFVSDSTGVNDLDDDLVFDLHDNCPCIYNPRQEDGDKDRIGDACCGTAAAGSASLAPVYQLLLRR